MLSLMIDAAVRSLVLGAIAGLGLLAFRIRNLRLERAVWTTVLGAALLMPALIQWPVLKIPALHMKTATAWDAVTVPSFQKQVLHTDVQIARVPQDHPGRADSQPFSWAALAAFIYFGVAGIFFSRLLFGLYRAWRIRQKATPIRESWTCGGDVRVSSTVRMPVTIGGTILLPEDFETWDFERRRAVIAHEQSHVASADSLRLSLASLHRAIFWISPLSWWLQRKLADLAEAISDEAALQDAPDRSSYAELLIDLAQRVERFPSGLAMARRGTVTRRVERILSQSSVALPFGWCHRAFVVIGAIPVVALVAGSSFVQSPAMAQPFPLMPLLLKGNAQEGPLPPSTPLVSSAVLAPAAPAAPSSAPEPPRASETPLPLTPLALKGNAQERLAAPPPPASPAPPVLAVVPKPSSASEAPSSPAPPEIAKRNWWWSSSSSREEPYVIVSGDSLTMSGSSEDAARARRLRTEAGTDYIWFVQDGKPYMISDPNVVSRAKALFKPQEELGRRQAELGDQQAKLGQQQARLGELQAQLKVHAPNTETLDRLERQLQQLRAALEASNGEISQKELSELQSRIGDLQSAFGEAQSRAGDKQSVLGERQSKLGEAQSKLGEQQSKLGEEQSRLAEEASRKMRALLDEAIHSGVAHRVQ
jgi:beta-lactamase regulating signal transducer with metallopeptidase domain